MTTKLSIKLTSWTLIVLLLCPAVSRASGDILTGGRLIAATPFDLKVFSTGVFSNENILQNTQPASSIEELFTVAKSFRYLHVSKKLWQTPEETEALGTGDCADKSVWLYAHLKQNGYQNVRLVIGKYRSIDTIFHVWVVYTDDQGKSYLLDPAIQKKVWEAACFEEGYYKAFYSYDGASRYRYDS